MAKNKFPVASAERTSSGEGGAASGLASGGVEVYSEMFRSLADQSLEFIGMCDLAFKPFYVNPAGLQLVGLDSLEEACAVKVQDFFFPEDQRYITEEFLPKVLREGRGEVEIRFRHFKSGTALWMIYNVFQVTDAQGRVRGYGTVSRNVTERKRAEEAVRESEEKYRLLFDTMTEGFGLHEIILDADGKPCDWRFLDLNAAWEQQTGMARAAVVGKTMRQVWPDLEAFWLEKFGKVALSGESVRSEGYHPHLQAWYEVLAYRTKPNQFAVVFTDITERKQAEEALRESEAKYHSLFNSIDDGFCIIEVLFGADGKANDYRFLEVNAAFERHSGLQGVAGKRVREMVPNQDAHWFETYGTVALTGEPARFATRGEALNRFFDVYAFRVGKPEERRVAVLFRDETERRQAEERLREERDFSAAILETAGALVVVLDTSGRIRRFNRACAVLTGYTEEEVLGQPVWVLIPPEDVAGVRQEWSTLNSGIRKSGHENHWLAKDGTRRLIAWSNTVLVGANGEIQHIVGTGLDITARKEVEAELERYRADLERLVAERTARLQELVGELEHFSYTITHDLKSPLRAMRGFAEIAGELCGASEARPFLEKISKSADRMDKLIADALNYSRAVRQELPLEDVDAGALLRGMLDAYPEFQPGKARVRVEGQLPVVLANEAGLTQCFSNLLGNAVKFVKPGQVPEIRVWAEEGKSEVRSQKSEHLAVGHHSEVSGRGKPGSGWVRIWVEDKGIGIAKEVLPRVFDMFSRASKEYDGTGIGLALVRKVVQRMGGKAGVESEEGKGSRFWIELKCGEGEVLLTEASALAKGTADKVGRQGMVLYVEDEESDAVFMERAFAGKGLSEMLRVVGDGRAAIHYLSGSGPYSDREKYPLPAVVLLDLNLPHVPGFQVLEWMRNHPDFRRTPVVIFSSSTREDDRVKAKELGANEFVSKPSSGLDFGKVVERLRGKWMGRTEVSR